MANVNSLRLKLRLYKNKDTCSLFLDISEKNLSQKVRMIQEGKRTI